MFNDDVQQNFVVDVPSDLVPYLLKLYDAYINSAAPSKQALIHEFWTIAEKLLPQLLGYRWDIIFPTHTTMRFIPFPQVISQDQQQPQIVSTDNSIVDTNGNYEFITH